MASRACEVPVLPVRLIFCSKLADRLFVAGERDINLYREHVLNSLFSNNKATSKRCLFLLPKTRFRSRLSDVTSCPRSELARGLSNLRFEVSLNVADEMMAKLFGDNRVAQGRRDEKPYRC